MPTENRRVATYLPQHISDRLEAFKSDRSIKGDSQALLVILSEFLGVSQNVAHQIAHSSNFVDADRFDELLARVAVLEEQRSQDKPDMPSSESLSELLGRIHQLESKVANLESSLRKDSTLSTGELAKRLGMSSSTLSHWKSSDLKRGKSPDELLKATREKDPDGIGWVLIPEINRFKPERDLPSSSDNVLQGELLNAQVV